MISDPTTEWIDGYTAVCDDDYRNRTAHALAVQMYRRGSCSEAIVREAYACVQASAEAIRQYVEDHPR